ncbi:glycoside hydrolase family 35 protein [Paenibacillus sp. KN14-4R]|uniref:glycoside hydrolase family 35 protein n=1 Tax=Paenibacillus sp. KN14-4R TaxID=3445773 RepID=UPI003FA16471
MNTFGIEGKHFVSNGKPVQLISGAIHYFRVLPAYWEDRLLKLKACGFNTVETYVAWNIHEPKKGEFQFEGMTDLVRFIEMAGDLGLHVIVRPSPYICAEWEFGGMPAWLLADPGMRLRCYHKPFLDHVDAYYDVLLPKLVPLLCTNGGPIIAMQIENEYGSYGNDIKYLNHLKESMIQRGIDVLLFTSDGPEDFMLQGGMVPDVLETVNFGSRPLEAFEKLKEYQSDKPLMCMEFWNGWFDHWSKEHHTRDADEVAQVFEAMLAAGASVNFYMFHGGTNFGFYNGANYADKYAPTITSYDYDVLLDESGEPTDKFYKVRDVISKFVDLPELKLPVQMPKRCYGEVSFTQQVGLFDSLHVLSSPIQCTCPETMEALGQDYGFILYTTHVSGPRQETELILQDVHDRALIFLDGQYLGVIERWNPQDQIHLAIPAGGATLQILVENMGRVNYGPFLKDQKGITEGARLGNQFLYDWTIHTLPLNDLSRLNFGENNTDVQAQPTFYRGNLQVDVPGDTFIKLSGWTKGVVYVNGFNLGRYWEVGPQQTLYVPAPLLREGENEIVLFELHGAKDYCVTLQDRAELG